MGILIGQILIANSGDQTAALQTLYNNANDGDILYLRALGGKKRMVIESPLNWTANKSIHVDATGIELYCGWALSGTQAMITWGAPLGGQCGLVSWRGGNIMGSLALQNVSYSRFEAAACDCLILQGDAKCSYNHFCYPGGGSGATGNGSAVIYNPLSKTWWADENRWHDTCLAGKPMLLQTSAAGAMSAYFYNCAFEGSGQFLNCPNIGPVFRDCYWEGAWMPGTYANVQVLNCAHDPFTQPTKIYAYEINE